MDKTILKIDLLYLYNEKLEGLLITEILMTGLIQVKVIMILMHMFVLGIYLIGLINFYHVMA